MTRTPADADDVRSILDSLRIDPRTWTASVGGASVKSTSMGLFSSSSFASPASMVGAGLGSALAIASSSGCAVSLFSARTRPALSFAYASLSSCEYTCRPARQSLLVGSEITVTTTELDASRRYTARLTTDAVGRITRQSERCACATTTAAGSTKRDIEPSDGCADGATKTCTHQATIATTNVGDTEFELHADGELDGHTTIKVRAAGRLDFTVTELGTRLFAIGGVHRIRVGAAVRVVASAYGDDGGMLVIGSGGVRAGSSAPDRLEVGNGYLEAVGIAEGDAELTLSAAGAETVARFSVGE